MKIKRIISSIVFLAFLISTITITILADSNVITVIEQKFNTQAAFDASTTTGDYAATPGVWGSAPSTVSLTADTGRDNGNDKSLLIGNRTSWSDTAKIRLNTSTIQAGKTYRLTVYFKNGDPTKGLLLTPGVSFYGADGNGGYPASSTYGTENADLGYTIEANKSGWVKYTSTFYITEDKVFGICEFHGFGLGIHFMQVWLKISLYIVD